MIAVQPRLLDEMLKEDYWRKKLEKANSIKEVEQILIDYCKTKGYKVIRVK